jgi:hypothetical protein
MDYLFAISVLGNDLGAWLGALVLITVDLALFYLSKGVGVARLSQLAARTTVQRDDVVVEVLVKTHGLFLMVLALFIGSLALRLPDTLRPRGCTA